MQQHRTRNDRLVAALYQHCAPGLFVYLRRQTRSREDAEDVLVDVFLAALEYESLEELDEKQQIAWLWRVARNKIIDLYRRSQRRQSIALEFAAETLYQDETLDPELLALQQDEYTLLRQHVQSLPALQQETLRLCFAEDLRCAEIATRIGKREGAVRVMLSRTLNALRRIYEGPQEDTTI